MQFNGHTILLLTPKQAYNKGLALPGDFRETEIYISEKPVERKNHRIVFIDDNHIGYTNETKNFKIIEKYKKFLK